MNELIPIRAAEIGGEDVNAILARDLHEFLAVGKDYSTWFKDRIVQYEFTLGVDFEVTVAADLLPEIGEQTRGGHNRVEHLVTLSMAKELAMVERTPKGKEARQYFIECERRAFAQPAVPQLNDPAALRGILLSYTEKVLALEAKVDAAKPKTEFFDKFINADGLYNLQNGARALGARPNLFIRHLKTKYLFYQGKALVPRINFIQMGVFEVKSEIIEGTAYYQTFITPKGIEYFSTRIPPEIKAAAA